MAQIQQRILIAAFLAVLIAPPAPGRRFYDDDPIDRMPDPMPLNETNRRKLSEYYDFFSHTFFRPGEKHEQQLIPAGGVNTLGEVPDSAWFTNRHGRKRMSLPELVRGPGDENPPATDAPWTVVAAKGEGITPGFTIEDSKKRRYLLKFDSLKAPELATGADAIGARAFYAIGYNTPENYIVRFAREQLRVDPKARMVDYRGVERSMKESDVEGLLKKVPRDNDGRYRGLASLLLAGKPVGPFRYYGTRTDDPNDIVLHEHRRDLRGLYVFAAWLNHTDTKALNSLDTLVKENGTKFIRHHLIDFGAILGSDSFVAKSPRSGHVYMFGWESSARNFFSLGLYVPKWMRADYPYIDGVGRIESDVFAPDEWLPNYYNPAFSNCLPDDAYWAAKIVMAFSDEDIRTLVGTGEYSDKEAVEFLIRSLIERRDKIGRTWFSRVLPLDAFRVDGNRLQFEDLAVKYKFTPQRDYKIFWARFDNESGRRSALAGTSLEIPAEVRSGYVVATLQADDPRKTVSVFLRNKGGSVEVVGVERQW